VDNKLKGTPETEDKQVAWKISYMPRISREVIEHKLGIDPSYKSVKQKERRYKPERQ
jgi:hypothetical protein